MEVLYALGGKGRSRIEGGVRVAMEKRMEPQLARRDCEILPSTGEPRWWSAVCWKRFVLKNEGCIRGDSPRGLWEPSDKGIAQAEAWLAESRGNFSDRLLAMPDVGEGADFDPPRSGPRQIDA